MQRINPNAAQLRQLRKDNLAWPTTLAEIARVDWPPMPFLEKVARTGVWRSRQFLVQRFDEPAGIVRLSINRTDWDERAKRFREDISWDDLQRLKAEAGYGDRCALEAFPADACVVNVANMRHLWVMPGVPSFVWNRHLALEAEQAAA